MKPSEREKMLAKARKMRQRKKSTYDEVPSGKLTSRVQKMKDALGGKKGAKVTSGTVVTFKDTGHGKGADPKGLFKPKKKTTTTSQRAKNTDAKDPRGNQIKATPGAAKKTKAAKKYNVGVSKGGVPFKEAFNYYRGEGNKTFTWNGKKYTTEVAKAKPKAKVSTPTPADFTMTGKKAAPKKPAKKPDAKDPRGNQIKATAGKSTMPKGAIRKYSGKYNSKTEKLRNIGGKTYVFKK